MNLQLFDHALFFLQTKKYFIYKSQVDAVRRNFQWLIWYWNWTRPCMFLIDNKLLIIHKYQYFLLSEYLCACKKREFSTHFKSFKDQDLSIKNMSTFYRSRSIYLQLLVISFYVPLMEKKVNTIMSVCWQTIAEKVMYYAYY